MANGFGATPFFGCPYCHSSLGSHCKTFGPSKVKCDNCDETVETGLTPWADLSIAKKLTTAIREILFPTYAYSNQLEGCLYLLVLFWLLIPIAFVKLILAIGESNRYSQTAVPPVWKPK
jgi:hypothetical protein